MKYFLPLFCILGIIAFVPRHVLAARMTLENAPTTVAQQQQFYVDVAIDPQGVPINGIQGSVSFSKDTLSFVRAETGTSVINYFIDPPTVHGNTVTFSGIVVGGFNGLIDPFDQTHTSPGSIVRLVFAGIAPGHAVISTSNVIATDNDGKGTIENVSDGSVSLVVSDLVTPSQYTTPDTVPPTLSASVVTDPNLYNGKYTLIFTATDKESGVDHVQLQEGNAPWVTIQSPYLLHDQSRKSILSLRAYDVAGNVTTVTIATQTTSVPVSFMLIMAILAIIITYVIYEKNKNKNVH